MTTNHRKPRSNKTTRKRIGRFGGDTHTFVDTVSKVKAREAHRKKVKENLDKLIKQAKLEELLREENRKIGQLSLTETTLSHFTKKPRRT